MSLLTRRRFNYSLRSSSKKSLLQWWFLLVRFSNYVERRFSVGKFARTILAFQLFMLILPVFLLSFVVLGVYRKAMKAWLHLTEETEMEIVDVTMRTAMVTNSNGPILTLVFALEGVLEEEVLVAWLEELLNQTDSSGLPVHVNFKRQLIRLKGFFAWKTNSAFQLCDHVTTGPSHHHGRTLTERNIQEYISEHCSKSLDPEKPPWIVQNVTGITEGGEPMTWVVFRLHHLLASQLNFPNFPSSLPNPWDTICSSRKFKLLKAPNATKKFGILLKSESWRYLKSGCISFYSLLYKMLIAARNVCNIKNIKEFVRNYETVRDFISKSCAYYNTKSVTYIDVFIILKESTTYIVAVIVFYMIKCIQKCFEIICVLTVILKIYATCFIRRLYFVTKEIVQGKNPQVNSLLEASKETYWMTRALLSLPRLIMEEIFATRSTVPLHIWRRKGHKQWNRTTVSWSEEVPLGGAQGIQGVTGASLSSVLITALSGGVRDLLRYSGVPTPENLRCTLPVYIPQVSPNHGLCPFSLPTGCSYGQKALREVCNYLEKIKKYPETYLASVWASKHISKFFPEIILSRILKYLTTSHPVLLINLVGPSTPTCLWGMKLKSTFYWRCLQQDAVISVCISSYCGRVSVGVLADGWAVPHAHILPQSFVSHLNELAVESGVKLQRQNSNLCSRRSSPKSTPSPTPPSTPTLNFGLKPYAYSSTLTNLQLDRFKRRRTHACMKKDEKKNEQIANSP